MQNDDTVRQQLGTAELLQANKELKQAEDGLRQSHDELRAIYDGMFDGLLIVDVESRRYVKANSSICRMLGYSETELLSLSITDIHPADEVPIVLERIHARVEGRLQGHVDTRMVRRDGSLLYADVVGFSFAYRGRDCVLAFFRDITATMRAEAALRQSHDELRAIYDGMADGLLAADVETKKFVRCNAAMQRMLGYSETELLSLSVMDIHPADEVPRVLELFRALVEGTQRMGQEIPVLRKDGSVFYADITHHSATLNGRSCSVGFFRDVTDRKQSQEALAKQHRTLKHLLQSSDRERQLIAYEIHDGLAQHLAGAIMQFQVFDHLKDTKPRRAVKAYEAGLTMLQHGHAETRRLIAGVRPPILDESGVVEAIAHLIHEQSREKGPKIEYVSRVDFDRLVPALENAIYRICQEALANACQHSKSEKVRVSLVQREDRVRIGVRDWGIGFDIKATAQNRYGLEGIQQRARLLDGKCRIRSSSGQGTRVIVELPVVEREDDA